MPITQADLQPFINQGTLGPTTPQQQSFAPSYGSLSTTGGPVSARNGGSALGGTGSLYGDLATSTLTGGLYGLPVLGDLFGGNSAGFKPYQDRRGNWVFAPASSRNPVPISNLPGASLTPGKVGKNQTDFAQTLYNILPYLNQAVNNTAVPTAQAGYNAAAATAGPYAQLMTDVFNQFGPQLNAIGNEINRRNALATSTTTNEVLNGPGQQTIQGALAGQKIADPEFFKTRDLTANRLSDLMKSIDLSGGLSDTERREIGQGLAQQATQRGTATNPSALDTVSNAMQFGQAGYQRQQIAKSNLATAIQGATSFLPTSKSGIDAFQVATGRPSLPNQGAGVFTGLGPSGTGQGGAQSLGLAGNLLNNSSAQQTNLDTIASQKKDWADYLSQVSSSVGNLGKAAGGIMCHIARKVYGEDNPKWMQFRHWLLNKAPRITRDLYLNYSERIAAKLTDKDIDKLRPIMDNILKGAY